MMIKKFEQFNQKLDIDFDKFRRLRKKTMHNINEFVFETHDDWLSLTQTYMVDDYNHTSFEEEYDVDQKRMLKFAELLVKKIKMYDVSNEPGKWIQVAETDLDKFINFLKVLQDLYNGVQNPQFNTYDSDFDEFGFY